jgi:hypothetical protein
VNYDFDLAALNSPNIDMMRKQRYAEAQRALSMQAWAYICADATRSWDASPQNLKADVTLTRCACGVFKPEGEECATCAPKTYLGIERSTEAVIRGKL